MDPIHVVDVMDPVLVTMNCMVLRKLRGMYHIIRKFPSTPNGWVGTRNRNWTLQKVFQSAEKRLPPSHHPVMDCTDYYSTNLAVLEIFQTAQLVFVSFFLPPKKTWFLCVFVPFHHQKTPINSCLPSPPKRFSKSTRLSGTSGTTKLARRAGAQCRCQCQKATMSSQRPGTSSGKYGKKHTNIEGFYEGGWEATYYSPNGGGMVIYRGRIRNLKHQKTHPRISKDFSTWHPNGPCFDWKRPCFGGQTTTKIEDKYPGPYNIPVDFRWESPHRVHLEMVHFSIAIS